MDKQKTSSETFEAPIVTVDAVLLTLVDGELSVALAQREAEPWKGYAALPGGYVHAEVDRSLEDAVNRVLAAKTGVTIAYLEQIYTLAGPFRDPRGWSVSVSYCALARSEDIHGLLKAGVEMVAIDQLGPLPFDHRQIVDLAVERVRNKASYSSLPAFLLPDVFTLSELQTVYEQVLGSPLERVGFRRKMAEQAFVEPVEGAFRTGAQRPAQLFRLRKRELSSFGRALTTV